MSNIEPLYQWLHPFSVEYLIPYWRIRSIDDLINQRVDYQLKGEYIVYIPDEDKWDCKWFSMLKTIGDIIEAIYPEIIPIRDTNGQFVNVRLYRCQINVKNEDE